MNNDKYVGLDVHSATIVAAVHDAAGNCVMESIIETKPKTIRDFIRAISGRVHVAFEQGMHAAWLFDLIRSFVYRIVVCDPRHNKLILSGSKSDKIDANKLAQLLRNGSLKPVYQGEATLRPLKELALQYNALVSDCTRVMSRIKAIFTGRAIPSGKQVYDPEHRAKWLAKLSEPVVRSRAESLFHQLDCINPLRQQAREALIYESRKQRATKLLRRIFSIGPIGAALIVAIVGNPHRFRTKRQFWAYCGFAVVTHSSADYKIVNGRMRRNPRNVLTRGLNHNYNRIMKKVFKMAAVFASEREPFAPYYQKMIDSGISPAMARLTLARKIAAIALAVWKSEQEFNPAKIFDHSVATKKALTRRRLRWKRSTNEVVTQSTEETPKKAERRQLKEKPATKTFVNKSTKGASKTIRAGN